MRRDLHGTLRHAQPFAHGGQPPHRLLSGQGALELLEQRSPVATLVAFAHARQHALEQGQRPGALEQTLGRERRRGSQSVAFVGAGHVERQGIVPASTLLRPLPVAMTCQVVLHGRQQEGAQAAASGVEAREVALLQELGEEALGHVLGLFRVHAAATHEGVERVPIGGAQGLERLPHAHRILSAHIQHHAPARAEEAVWAGARAG